MTEDVPPKLAVLRAEYSAFMGRSFQYFFCPILQRDDQAELCDGHIINTAFTGSDRSSVVQRKDVDNFFGSCFEGEFVLIQDRGRHSPIEILLDADLSRKFRPRITVDGEPVSHYLPTGPVPAIHSQVMVEREGLPPRRLALKLEPSDAMSALGGNWQVQMNRDIRLAALVSLLKAAHLTLFALMGYSYALTTAGRFVGWDILGQFTDRNMGLDKPTVLANAAQHFPEFANLVRPMTAAPTGITGTITDRQLFLCTGSPKAWAFMVFIRTGEDMHAVLLPVMEDGESAARFLRFLKDPPQRFEIKAARFAGDRWEVAKTGRMIDWPAARFNE